jgi:hypothetical protein
MGLSCAWFIADQSFRHRSLQARIENRLPPLPQSPAARIPRRVALPRLMASAAREAEIVRDIKNEHRTY